LPDPLRFLQLLLQDRQYALIEVFIIPYPEEQCHVDGNIYLFSSCPSQAHVEMTENIYRIMKQRFPVVKYISLNLLNAINIIVSASIPHHIYLNWTDPMPGDDQSNQLMIREPLQPTHLQLNEVNIVNLLNPSE
jgi:hypothetical protein